MSLIPVQRKQRVTGKPGEPSGASLGQKVGMGLGAIAGGLAGGPAGAVQGSLLGAQLGGLAGGMVQPGQASTQQVQQSRALPLVQVTQQSQQILDGLRALESFEPEIQAEYAQPLTQAYLASMVELKNRDAMG